MSKENTWKEFNQLLVSPSVIYGRTVPKRAASRYPGNRVNIRKSILNVQGQNDSFDIEDVSEDETVADNRRFESIQSFPTFTPSVAQSLNPAEVTIDPPQSDSEVEHISEDEACCRYSTTSDSSNPDDDDCLAINCTKSRMTRLKFVDKKQLKRRRITDEMDVSFAAGPSKVKHRRLGIVSSPKRFKPVSALNRSIARERAEISNSNSIMMMDGAVANSTRCWKSFDESFTEQDVSCIEDLPSSSDSGNEGQLGLPEPFRIDALPPSAEENNNPKNRLAGNSSTTPPSKSFYVLSPTGKRKTIQYPRNASLGTLSKALNERSSRQQLWQHSIMSGAVQPDLVVKIDSMERIYGRVMLRFFTTATEEDECLQDQVENIIYMDQGDRQLKSIHAGMEIALEMDDTIAPHRIARNKLVHLGVTKLCPISLCPTNKTAPQ
uniref:Uncharacterized protein n=1 Tax=Anopheles epiroticus TaxID=199890 RepID=A0A182PAF0_9DIPT